ncbi:hypothetical protein [Sphingomonas sp. YR710]|uniref:hypothetical protein n=1 Tax=Sphingomonas sp. YR710 TaxID=1882773 RepID=UPI00115FCC01|nr:hypothetical protein [Sphingomonas sp. YR710]
MTSIHQTYCFDRSRREIGERWIMERCGSLVTMPIVHGAALYVEACDTGKLCIKAGEPEWESINGVWMAVGDEREILDILKWVVNLARFHGFRPNLRACVDILVTCEFDNAESMREFESTLGASPI